MKHVQKKKKAKSRKRQQGTKETIPRQLNLGSPDYNSGSPDAQSKLMCPIHDKLEEHHQNYQHCNHEDTYRACVECDKPQEGRE
jgi:hypothetical protein